MRAQALENLLTWVWKRCFPLANGRNGAQTKSSVLLQHGRDCEGPLTYRKRLESISKKVGRKSLARG